MWYWTMVIQEKSAVRSLNFMQFGQYQSEYLKVFEEQYVSKTKNA